MARFSQQYALEVFRKVLVFAFNLSEADSDQAKELFLNFLRVNPAYRGGKKDNLENMFTEKPLDVDDIIDALEGLHDEQTLFYYMLQSYALATAGGVSEEIKKTLDHILVAVDVDREAREILHDIFIEENFTNPGVLFIGNDSMLCDIVKTYELMHAFIIRFAGTDYFIARQSNGLIMVNDHVVFDYVVFRLDDAYRIAIESTILTQSDISLRFDLKENDLHMLFSIVESNDEGNSTYYLVPEDMENCIGQIFIQGCRVIVMNRRGSVSISIGEYSVGENIYIGCLDDEILIGDSFFFNLSRELESVFLYKSIASTMVRRERIIIGNDESFDIVLPVGSHGKKVKVVLEHYEGNQWLLDASEANVPILIDDIRLNDTKQLLHSGAIISIDGSNVLFNPEKDEVVLVRNKIHTVRAKRLAFIYNNGQQGLGKVFFENRSKDFVCIMGPSGAGKSTLVKVLTGYFIPTPSDSLQYNEHEFAKHYHAFKRYVGYVPQDDQLFENLTVRENMRYYGRLRLPELTREELDRKIQHLLSEFGLLDKQHDIVGSPEKRVLSGGERKRLNIALELLSDCDVLVLDEPTSGLSSYDTLKTIDILSYVARQGKIVYVVIHQPSREVFLKFSHLILLDRGGHMAYFGETERSFDYFERYAHSKEINEPNEIFEVLEAVKRTSNGEMLFEYDEKNNRIPMRVKTPLQWTAEYALRRNEYYSTIHRDATFEEVMLPRAPKDGWREALTRFGALFLRNFKNKMKDTSFTLFSVVIPAFLAIALSFVLRYNEGEGAYVYEENYHIPKFLFLTSIIIIFLATSNAINTILKDRIHLDKEKLIGYSPFYYLFGVVATHAIINLYQILIYLTISFLILKIPIVIVYDGYFYAGLFVKFFALSFIASLSVTAFALFISSYLKSEKAAFLAVPLIIIPQIIFGGMFLNFAELKMLNPVNENRPVPIVCGLTHARWMYEAYLNVMRYDHPGKMRVFKTSAFRKRYGSFNNEEVIKIFRTYNLSKARDDAIKEARDEQQIEKMRTFTDAVEALEEKNLPLSEYLDLEFKHSCNFFPYYKKILYPFVISTFRYDALVLLIGFILFFIATSSRLRKI